MKFVGMTALAKVAAVLGCFAAVPAMAQNKVQIRLGHVLAESHSWNVAAKGFAEDVAKATEGRVTIQVFPSGQLGTEKDVVEGLQIGTMQGGVIGSGSFQPIEPRMGIVELPYACAAGRTAIATSAPRRRRSTSRKI